MTRIAFALFALLLAPLTFPEAASSAPGHHEEAEAPPAAEEESTDAIEAEGEEEEEEKWDVNNPTRRMDNDPDRHYGDDLVGGRRQSRRLDRPLRHARRPVHRPDRRG